MWIEDKDKMQDLVERLGSPYAACIYIAKMSRKLQKESYNVVSESQAVCWAISGNSPKDLEQRIQSKMRETEEVKESDKLEDILSAIEEEKIRIAVLNSYRASVKSNRIIFDYNNIKDKGTRTRIRILVKMLFLS